MKYRKRAVLSQVKSEQLAHSNVTTLFNHFSLENIFTLIQDYNRERIITAGGLDSCFDCSSLFHLPILSFSHIP